MQISARLIFQSESREHIVIGCIIAEKNLNFTCLGWPSNWSHRMALAFRRRSINNFLCLLFIEYLSAIAIRFFFFVPRARVTVNFPLHSNVDIIFIHIPSSRARDNFAIGFEISKSADSSDIFYPPWIVIDPP